MILKGRAQNQGGRVIPVRCPQYCAGASAQARTGVCVLEEPERLAQGDTPVCPGGRCARRSTPLRRLWARALLWSHDASHQAQTAWLCAALAGLVWALAGGRWALLPVGLTAYTAFLSCRNTSLPVVWEHEDGLRPPAPSPQAWRPWTFEE